MSKGYMAKNGFSPLLKTKGGTGFLTPRYAHMCLIMVEYAYNSICNQFLTNITMSKCVPLESPFDTVRNYVVLNLFGHLNSTPDLGFLI